jgi:solute carrier family 45 protein 1/2/4
MIPPIADGDPDPTTQISWPSARSRHTTELDESAVVDDGVMQNAPEINGNAKVTPAKRRLTTWDLVTLSISMGGAQIAWTVELGYGFSNYDYSSDPDCLVMGRHFS